MSKENNNIRKTVSDEFCFCVFYFHIKRMSWHDPIENSQIMIQ